MQSYRANWRRRRGSAMAEFGPVLWLFLILIVLPFFDFISFCSGVATVMMMSTMSARQAAGALTFGDAQAGAASTEQQLKSFLKFSKATPGFPTGSGVQVTVLVTPSNPASGLTSQGPFSTWGSIPNGDPNRADANTYNSSTCIYQYIVTSKYDVMPLFNFAGSPMLKGIPGLGAAVPVTYSATATVEHVDGLNQGPTSAAASGS